MRHLLFFFLSCSFLTPGLAQNKSIDSIRQVIESNTSDVVLVKAYSDLGTEFYSVSTDSALFYWEKSRKLAILKREGVKRKSKEDTLLTQSLIANLNNLGYWKINCGDTVTGAGMYRQAYKLSLYINDKDGLGTALNNLGLYYGRFDNYLKAISSFERAIKVRKKLEDRSLLASSFNSLGVVYEKLGDYHQALNYYSQALHINEDDKDLMGMAYNYANIGQVYLNTKQVEKGISYYYKSMNLRDSIGDFRGMVYSMANLGAAFNSLERYSDAVSTLEEAFALA